MTPTRILSALVLVALLASPALAFGGVPVFPGGGTGGGAVSSVTAAVGGCVTVSQNTGAVVITSSGCAGGGVTSAVAGTGISVSGATGAVTFSLATQVTQTIMGNGSGSTTAPVALTVSAANGLVASSSTLNWVLAAGKSGGTSMICGTGSGDGCAVSTTSNATKGQFTLSDGQFAAPIGSAAAPTYTFTGALTDGMYWDSSNSRVSFSVAGNLVASISATALNIQSGSAVLQFAAEANIARNGTGGLNFNATNGNGTLVFQTSASNTARYTINPNGTHLWSNIAPTVASASGAVLDALKFASSTVTISGSTAITTSTGLNFFDIEAQTYTAASAVAITNAAAFTIKAAPIAAGSVTIANSYALWVQAGTSLFGGPVALSNTLATPGSGVIVTTDAPTSVVSLSLKYINLQLNGVATYVLALQ